MAQYMQERRESRRKAMRERLGGKCVACGSEIDLEFDHRDPDTKTIEISSPKLLDGPMDILIAEVDKCQLLCTPCHRIKTKENGDPNGGGHNRIDDYGHGTGHMYYKQRCKCDTCCEWRRRYRAKEVTYSGDLRIIPD